MLLSEFHYRAKTCRRPTKPNTHHTFLSWQLMLAKLKIFCAHSKCRCDMCQLYEIALLEACSNSRVFNSETDSTRNPPSQQPCATFCPCSQNTPNPGQPFRFHSGLEMTNAPSSVQWVGLHGRSSQNSGLNNESICRMILSFLFIYLWNPQEIIFFTEVAISNLMVVSLFFNGSFPQ